MSMHAFLMAGQSNMAGRGIIGEVPEIAPVGRMYMLRNGRWQPMSEPINPDRQIFVDSPNKLRSGVSLAASFAEAWTRQYEGCIGLIPCADGGSSIDEWMPGGVLFDNAVFTTRLALRSSALDGILWHQGESDSKTEKAARTHSAKLEYVANELRSAIGCAKIPFIMGELAYDMPRWPFTQLVNEGMHALCQRRSDFVLASAQGYEIGPDGMHFTAKFYREFGCRYFEQYEGTQK